MAQMVFSQGSSPFANGEVGLPEMPRAAPNAPLQLPANPPMGSWFNVPVSGLTNGPMDVGAANGRAGSGQFSVMQNNRAAHKPTLKLIGMPPKSRVETQIHLKMTLHPVPDGVKKIRLPLHTISKPKFLVKPRPPPQPDTLELYTQLVCSSAMDKANLRERAFARAAASGHPSGGLPDSDEDKTEDGGEVRICAGCVTREQKRANRKKNKKPDEDEDWKRHESHRVIVFNTHEIKELKSPEPEYSTAPGSMLIDIPMRIACYCRHHHEKQGFRVIFTLKDFQGRLVTQCLSPSIMITDDHKTPQSNSQHHGSMEMAEQAPGLSGSTDLNAIQPGIPFRQSQSTSDIQALKRSASALSAQPLHSGNSSLGTSAAQTPRNLSRPASPGSAGPIAKKRKSSASKIPTTLTMTRIETPAFAPTSGNAQQNGMARPTSATSPFSPSNSIPFADGPSPAYGQVTAPPNPMFPAAVAPTTPNGSEQMLFQSDAIRTTGAESRAMSVMYSAPASAQNSRAPSPNAIMNGMLPPQQLNQLSQVSQVIHSGVPMADNLQMAQFANAQRQQMASILKVLPNEGPTSGGIEVSILGSGFRQGQEVYFGDTKATTTTYWADSAITCILPPYHTTGQVPVSVRSSQGLMQSAPRQTAQFMYKDENQDQLAHLALGVLHHKLTGSIGDTKGFIQRILAAENGGGSFSDGASGSFSLNTLAMETQLLRMLDLMDIDDSLNRAKLDAKRKITGHTMLHLSVALGYYRFTAALLVRGANPNARDVGGYTPLHYAALHNHAELVRRLIINNADPTIRTKQGLLASDIATTRDIIRTIKQTTRRGNTVHSRANSATSLRSFWEPPLQHSVPSDFSEASDSDGYADSSSEDEGNLEGGYLDMALRTRKRHEARASTVSLVEVPEADEQGGMAAAAVAMANIKDQIQQMHQSLVQNFAAMQDYPGMLASLHAAQQRVSALIAGPPAYHDLFPGNRHDDKRALEHGDFDTKQASAIQAATDYDADRKCSALYDEQQQIQQIESSQMTTEHVQEKQVKRQLPNVLTIGRKNNITKEQQDDLRQARAEKQKSLRSDHKLWLFWVSTIPFYAATLRTLTSSIASDLALDLLHLLSDHLQLHLETRPPLRID